MRALLEPVEKVLEQTLSPMTPVNPLERVAPANSAAPLIPARPRGPVQGRPGDQDTLRLPLTAQEQADGVCRNLCDLAASFCGLPSETLLKLDDREIHRIRRALTGALVVLRLAEGIGKA